MSEAPSPSITTVPSLGTMDFEEEKILRFKFFTWTRKIA